MEKPLMFTLICVEKSELKEKKQNFTKFIKFKMSRKCNKLPGK